MFDLVLLLSKGRIVYFGKAQNMINYFSSIHYECPIHSNPADFFCN